MAGKAVCHPFAARQAMLRTTQKTVMNPTKNSPFSEDVQIYLIMAHNAQSTVPLLGPKA